VRLLLNIILAFQRKMLFPFAPTSVPFNPIFFLFFTFLLLLILLNNYRKIVRKKIKKIPNINLRQGINPILLFFLNWSLNKNFSEKTKSVPHSPGLPYKEYFGVEYPLPKMDLVAVADFAACNLIHFNIIPSPFSLNALRCHLLGVMENRGLVTYRETCLVVDEQNTSTQRRKWVAIVLGHELAHQYGSAKMSRW
jgi:hypothetical protein